MQAKGDFEARFSEPVCAALYSLSNWHKISVRSLGLACWIAYFSIRRRLRTNTM
jgi:hypothetical protein